MARIVEEPVEELRDEGTAHERLVTTHPAYAMISAGRVSGGQTLYGSDLQHQHYMTISVTRAETHRHLSNDWHHAEIREIIEVAMSEAQWQAFVSSPNTTGVPCTLVAFNGKQIPALPRPKSRGKQFMDEARASVNHALGEVQKLVSEIEGMNLSGVKKRALIGQINTVNAALESSLPFVMDQFVEHMEDQVQRAKAEINSHARHVLGPGAQSPLLEGQPTVKRITRSKQ